MQVKFRFLNQQDRRTGQGLLIGHCRQELRLYQDLQQCHYERALQTMPLVSNLCFDTGKWVFDHKGRAWHHQPLKFRGLCPDKRLAPNHFAEPLIDPGLKFPDLVGLTLGVLLVWSE